jgi:hypothetical protein
VWEVRKPTVMSAVLSLAGTESSQEAVGIFSMTVAKIWLIKGKCLQCSFVNRFIYLVAEPYDVRTRVNEIWVGDTL